MNRLAGPLMGLHTRPVSYLCVALVGLAAWGRPGYTSLDSAAIVGGEGVKAVSHFTCHRDEHLLNAYADSAEVPRELMWTVAKLESGCGEQGNKYLGQGVVRLETKHYDHGVRTVYDVPTRRCREIGRMQINPCAHLERLFGPRCSPAQVINIRNNLWCGSRYLKSNMPRWWRYNGPGDTHIYQHNGRAYLGELYERKLLT